MDINDIPLFAQLKGRMGYLNQRENLISQNVANADTPGFVPKDLKRFTIDAQNGVTQGGLQMVAPAQTDPGHMSGVSTSDGGQWKPLNMPDSETTLDGNQVVLEEQMLKMTEAKMSYDAAVGFYQKSLGLLQLAMRAPK